MHIVHMRQDFKSLEEALKDKTGVAVLGFFYEVPLLNVFFIISVRISYNISSLKGFAQQNAVMEST